jgi:OPA family sugar phosphate sensor protein UhpC-like MFS transporter
MSKFLNFYKTSAPSETKVAAAESDKLYKKLRFQSFVAGTLGYSLYYVCRTSLNVMKQPIIDSGFLDAAQLGVIGSCLLFAYAIGKFVNGFLADHSNIKRFMATGLLISALCNFLMGALGFWEGAASATGIGMFLAFAVIWAISGWSQSMGSPPAIIALSRWYPITQRGTFYGFFSASHNIGEWLSFLFVGLVVAAFGWQWGFFGSATAGIIGVVIIVFFMHDTPESKGLAPVEILAGEMTEEEYAAAQAKKQAEAAADKANKDEVTALQKKVLLNPGVWIIALSSAFMYISRYAINGWGTLFLQKVKGFELSEATFLISINALCGIFGTVLSGWFSDKLFKGDRRYPALLFGALNSVALTIFLYGGNSWWVNALAMVLFGTAIGVLICFLGGLMAVDLVPRKASGAALGVVGMASYAAAGIQDIVSGVLIDNNITTEMVNGVAEQVYDFGPAIIFWIAASVISFVLPLFNWKKTKVNR